MGESWWRSIGGIGTWAGEARELPEGHVGEVVDEWSEGACRVALVGVEAEGGGFGEMVAAMQAVSEQGGAGIRGTGHPGNGEVAVGGIGEAGGNQFVTLENHPG